MSSADHLAAATTLITVVPATSTARGWPNHVVLTGPSGLAEPTVAMTEQVRTSSRQRVAEQVGQVDGERFAAICRWVHRWLAGV